MGDKEYNPLVSITVITYNSSKFVLETLESIKTQTYRNIELIVSDDCSTDNTVEICREWIEKNKERFVETHLITSPVNTGIPANKNRALAKCKGEWVKGIAGDDLLIANAIEVVMEGIKTKKNSIEIVDSRVLIFNNDFTKQIGKFELNNSEFFKDEITPKEQLKILVKNLNKRRIISTLGVFVSRQLIKKVGGYDENFKLLEDTPFWFRVLKNNTKFYYIDKPTVMYRRHENAVSFNKSKPTNKKVISDFKLTVDQFFWEYAYNESSFFQRINLAWNRSITRLVLFFGNKGLIAKTINRVGYLLQPIRFYNLVNKLKS